MEKEKILQQLEEKLLPSVKNLEKEQASEHDFFPALLWMLLEKNKDSENLLKNFLFQNHEDITKASETIQQNTAEKIIKNNKENKEEYLEQLRESNIKSEELLKKVTLQLNQKIEGIKNWFFVSFIFHIITITALVIIFMKK